MSNRSTRSSKVAAGFTLVEVLISMVVFSMLMVLVSNAMSFATQYWSQEHGNLKDKISEFIYTEKLYRSVAAMQPYAVKYIATREVGIFFQGTSQSITFVSEIGIYEKGPVIVALRVAESDDLGMQIQLAEEPIASSMLITPADLNMINWQWKNIKSNLVSANFRFYGYESLSQLMLDRSKISQAPAKVNWFDTYSGEERKVLPLKLSLEWQEVKNQQTLDFSIDFPVMINSRDRYNFIEKTLYVK